MIQAEYIWIDGTKPVPKLRSKTKILPSIIEEHHLQFPVLHSSIPVWGFDGSSTKQAEGHSSDCVLIPVRVVIDPLRDQGLLVLCEVYNSDLEPDKNNKRAQAQKVAVLYADQEPLFGIEQEYTFFRGRSPLGWPENGYPAPQGPFYCGIGADEVFGRQIVQDHIDACLAAGLALAGVNAEVMPGQWEFQIGPADALEVSDHLWLARYLLYRIAENYGVNAKLDPKPISGDWNGAGAHTNFSTIAMRGTGGFDACVEGARKLGLDVSGELVDIGQKITTHMFPHGYGVGFEQRLTGLHETCSWKEFKFGIADRTASIRIPLHVQTNGCGYIEDRRPCANIDPYWVVTYLINCICG
jgi:glutamine synthetase